MTKLVVNEKILNQLKPGNNSFCSSDFLDPEKDKELYLKFDEICAKTAECEECLREFITTVLVNVQEEKKNEES